MPTRTQRAPLQPISGNARRGTELSTFVRGQIIAKNEAGLSSRQIEAQTGVLAATCRQTVRRNKQRVDGQSRPRAGRPRASNAATDIRVITWARAHPKGIYRDMIRELSLPFAETTCRKILDSVGIRSWRAKKHPFLTPELAKKRLDWALKHRNWTDSEWDKVIFSDECSIEKGAGGTYKWVWCRPNERNDPLFIDPERKKGIRKMVWAGIRAGKKVQLVLMERDLSAKREGYTSRSYLKILEHHQSQICEKGIIFMQDNAPIHTAKVIRQWFRDHGVEVLDWPPYSPDLNPIEHLWVRIKRWIVDNRPDILKPGRAQSDFEALEQAIQEAWEAIPEDFVASLTGSMRNRVQAVIAANGWHTKY